MHIDVYEAIQLTVIALFPILLRRNIFKGPQRWNLLNDKQDEAQCSKFFSGAWTASGTVGPEMRRKDFNKGPIQASEKAVYLDKLSVITNA